MMYNSEAIVIGAGVVGLAVARSLALLGLKPIIIEAERQIGMGTSARSSEVIHAGLHYSEGSLKAALCFRGRELLYNYCEARNVPHRRCGKILVAASEAQRLDLEHILRSSASAGVDDLQCLETTDLVRLEPELRGVTGLLSPSTGIVDAHALMQALQGEAEALGAQVVLRSPVKAISEDAGMMSVALHGDEKAVIRTRLLVNAAGLGAQSLARTIDSIPQAAIPALHYAKGRYFTLAGRAPFRHLIYPIPEADGLGIHLTFDMAGAARFGPDVEWVNELDYSVDAAAADSFYIAIRRYWPMLPDGALSPGYAGIRPKISGPGEPAADFVIQGHEDHGIAGLINLFGIESPGLTSALAIGEHVGAMVNQFR